MKQAYFVPNFPVNKITMTGEDGWCHMPNHPRMKYKYLDAVLEHIDNSGRIDPIMIIIHDENQVHAGPSGVARLFALMNYRKYTHVPVIVSSPIQYNWFGDGVEKILNEQKFLSYFSKDYLPKSYTLNEQGAYWSNHNIFIHDVEHSMKVSKETKNRLRMLVEEENR